MKRLGSGCSGWWDWWSSRPGCSSAYFFVRYPDVPPPEDVKVAATPERLARGEYLVENVVGCVVCHAERDLTKYSGPVVDGTKGKGGQRFGFGLEPFVIYTKNITPAGIGEWTDGELIRAITAGVSRDGTPLFPLMPYPHYAKMAREDVEAIVAYLRTLPARAGASELPARQLNFPLPLVVRTIPDGAVAPAGAAGVRSRRLRRVPGERGRLRRLPHADGRPGRAAARAWTSPAARRSRRTASAWSARPTSRPTPAPASAPGPRSSSWTSSAPSAAPRPAPSRATSACRTPRCRGPTTPA